LLEQLVVLVGVRQRAAEGREQNAPPAVVRFGNAAMMVVAVPVVVFMIVVVIMVMAVVMAMAAMAALAGVGVFLVGMHGVSLNRLS
jgi:hypothetical protein